MRPSALIPAAALALALGACTTVGPNYAVPKSAEVNAPAAQAPFAGAGLAPVAQAPVPDDWWRLYDDPALDALVETALHANTDVRVAAANLARAQAVSAEVVAADRPTVSVSGAAERAQLSGEDYLLNQPLPASNLGDAGVSVAYQIDLVGRLRRAAEAAHADAQASADALDAARVSVAAEVTRAYVDACASGWRLKVAQHTVDLQIQSLSVAQALAKAGRGTDSDVLRSRSLVDQSKAAAPLFIARRRSALYKLAVLTGKPPTEFPAALEACETLPRLSRPIPVGDGAALLRRRPDVRQAERTLAAATARIGVATAALYPTVGIGLDTGASGVLADLGKAATNYWSLGALIHWTLPTGGERARIRETDAAADAALARFDGVVLNALRETETSLNVYGHDLDRNASLRAARDEAAEAAHQVQDLYRAGRSPYLADLDARRSLAAVEAALAASDAQVADDQVGLFLALGGGWSGK